MTSRSRSAAAILAFLLLAPLPALPGAARASTVETRVRMARDVSRLVPPALGRVLRRHPQAWNEGWEQGYTGEDRAAEAGRRIEAAFDAIRRRADADTFSRLLGGAARLAADASEPLAGNSTAALYLRLEGSDAEFERYAAGVVARTPAVFRGWQDDEALLSGLPAFFESRERHARADAEALRLAFHPGGAPVPLRVSSFDDRSIPFAVASLSYSRAVSDAANILFAIWKRIGGDTTGTRWLGSSAPPERRP